MAEEPNPKSRRRLWKTVLLILVALTLAFGVAVLLLPSILPQSVVRRQVEAALTEHLGRPVTVEWARFAWGGGLEVRGVTFAQVPRDGAGDADSAAPPAPLATAEVLTARFNPVESLKAVLGGDPPLDSLRVEGLDVWLSVDAGGRWNVEAPPRNPDAPNPTPRAIQVNRGTIHFENRATGRSLTLTNLRASLGQLESTGQGYVNVEAEFPGDPAGQVRFWAGLDTLDLGGGQRPAGSLTFEWTGLPWAELLGTVSDDATLARLVRETSGRVAVSFGRGAWTAEGSVAAANVTLPYAVEESEITLADATLGFQLRQAAGDKPVEVNLIRLTAPGIELKAWGDVRPEPSPAEAAAAKSAAQGPPGPPLPPAEPRPPRLGLHATGRIVWAPLCRNVPALKPLADQFDKLSGYADLSAHLEDTPDGLHLVGWMDLLHTQVVWPHVVQKESERALRLEWDTLISSRGAVADVSRLELMTEAGRLTAKGRVPLNFKAGSAAARLAGATAEVRADVRETETLLALLPALGEALAPLRAEGPMTVQASCQPAPQPAAPAGAVAPLPAPVWLAKVRADLTGARVIGPDGAEKRPGVRGTLDVSAALDPEGRTVNVFSAGVGLGSAAIQWTGTANVAWRAVGGPGVRLDGAVRLTDVEGLLPIAAPGRFAENALPVAGRASLDLLGEAADGRFRGKVKADLSALKIDLGDYLVKPAGEAAALEINAFWQPDPAAGDADWRRFLAEAEVRIPGVSLRAFGRGAAALRGQVEKLEVADGPRRAVRLSGRFSDDSRLELRLAVADTAKALAALPGLARGLKDQRLDGSVSARLDLTLLQDALRVAGGVDLTDAAVRLGGGAGKIAILDKPADVPLKLDLALAVAPQEDGAATLELVTAEARLDESTVTARGWAGVLRPAAWANLATPDQVLALFKDARLEVQADVRHTRLLRQTLPCLEAPLYAKVNLDGLTQLVLSFAGTPLQGRIHLEVDGTRCKILKEQAILKPAGTAARMTADAVYGEVPGELLLSALGLTLADSTVSAEARLLFDDPRLTQALARLLETGSPAWAGPSAWTLHVKGSAPDAAALAALFPARLSDLSPSGGIAFDVAAAGDPRGADLLACDFRFNKAGLMWLERPFQLNGDLSYNRQRLATDGLNIVAGRSDVTLVAYVMQPDRAPSGKGILSGKTLDLDELLGLIVRTRNQGEAWAAAETGAASQPRRAGPRPLSEQLALSANRLLARAQLSCELKLDRFVYTVPAWDATYELTNVTGEGRLADLQLTLPTLKAAVDQGTFDTQVVMDFRGETAMLSLAYDARNLQMQDNLKPFIESTFPGMQVFGRVSQRNAQTRPLTKDAYPTGRGETVLTDGLLEGPAAPSYITDLLPGLKLTQYRFNRMTSHFEDKGDGRVENRMIFEGKAYDLFIFGTTNQKDGRVEYTLGVDLSVGLGSKALTWELDQGKLPLMYCTGRIVGSKFAEFNLRYVLPHEFAYEVFVRRNVLLQLFARIGEKPPRINRPPVLPPVDREGTPGPG
jgi:hypothetical protein